MPKRLIIGQVDRVVRGYAKDGHVCPAAKHGKSLISNTEDRFVVLEVHINEPKRPHSPQNHHLLIPPSGIFVAHYASSFPASEWHVGSP